MLVPALAFLVAPLCPLPPIPASEGSGGNVCVIVLDDVVPGMLGCYDADFRAQGRPSQGGASTPQIDSVLAAHGMRFGRVWAAPSCSPTRAAMLTGRCGSRNGIGQVIPPRGERPMPGLDPQVELLPGLLRLAPQPYASAAIGKWHLADNAQTLQLPPHPLGTAGAPWFERFAGTWNNFQGNSIYSAGGYYVWTKEFATRIDPFVSPCPGEEPPCTLGLDTNLSPLEYPTVDTVNDAITLVQTLQEPWFLWVAPHAAHVPLHPLPDGLPANPCTGDAAPDSSCTYPGLNSLQSRARCMLEALDHQLGRLFCELDFNDTTVILTSDNGWGARSVVAPYSNARAKGSVYEGAIEAPLIVRSPRIPPALRGTSSEALVSLVDVFDTVRELADAPPAVAAEDSVSFLGVLEGQVASARPLLYAEGFSPNFLPLTPLGGPPPGYVCQRHDQALRDDRFKLVRRARATPSGVPSIVEELYDLLEGGPPDTSVQPPRLRPDWHEQNNLLAAGATLSLEAAFALQNLRDALAAEHASLLR
jgi:arylsulfatase B